MCGRFSLSSSAETVAAMFELAGVPDLPPRYNIAPTQPVAAVRFDAVAACRELCELRWGLIPSWSKEPGIGARMINARAETAASKPSFRAAFRRRRCLIVADGFFEWQKRPRRKKPYYIRMLDGRPFAFAGLWEHWEGPGGRAIDSCTILTTEPNKTVEPIHDRMPVILPASEYSRWLDPATTEPLAISSLLRPFPSEQMEAYPVGTQVNNPSNDEAACVAPAP